MLLEAEDIFAGYGHIEVLHGVSLKVVDSGITVLIGPNGAGKSTFLKAIVGFVKVRAGCITLDSNEITNASPENLYLRGVRYLHQGRSTFPRFTVLENLRIAAYHNNDPKHVQEQIEGVFERFPVLGERRRQLASRLSGGEQRMLELGRAFMFEPRLIMLDEPSLGLAPALTDDLYETIGNLASDSRVTFLIVEQNVSKALEVAEECIVLDLGQVVFSGTPNELLRDNRIVDLYIGHRKA